jgi:tripartite-type tricarboxylate transporter receptor subunit TctC
MPTRIALITWFVVLAALAGVLDAPAQAYPSRPITIVSGFAAGSGDDTHARLIARYLEAAINQGVVVENKVGANAAIAAGYVARAAPDGYTLLKASVGVLAANPALYRSISYDAAKDFAPISLTGRGTFLLVVNSHVPANSIAELIAYAKANPGKLLFASSNSNGVIAGETFKRWANIDIVHVPYKTAPPAINDLVGGHVSMMFADMTTALPHIRANALRALAVMTRDRSALLPDLPSLHEAGMTDFEINSWNGLVAPANTPKDIVTRLNTEIRRIVADPVLKAQFAEIGTEIFSSTPEEMGDLIRTDLVRWAKMIKDAGIEPQ